MKACEQCAGPTFRRRRGDGKLETNTAFARRRFCSRQCAALSRQAALHHSPSGSRRKRTGDGCLTCQTALVPRSRETVYAFERRKYCDRVCYRVGITFNVEEQS